MRTLRLYAICVAVSRKLSTSLGFTLARTRRLKYNLSMRKVLVAATSMDGYISQSTNQVSTAWTSKADKHFFVELSTSLKYLVMGFNTWQTIKRPLPNRNIIVLSSAGNLEVDLNAPLCLCALPIPELIRQLEDKGVKHLCIAGGSGVYSQFLSLHLVDEVFLTIEPVFLGGGVPLFQNVYSPVKLDVKERFLISGQTQVIRAKPIYDKQF